MYFLLIFFLFLITDNLVIVKIHRNTLYHPNSSCAFIHNVSLTTDPSIQSCIWNCVHEYNCQTAVYYKNLKICSLFSEMNNIGQLQPSGNLQASVICYQKNHNPVTTCSRSTMTTTSSSPITATTTCSYPIIVPVIPGPTTLVGYRNDVYQNFTFTVTGSTSGSIWGTDIYTDDSNLATAAVHAGIIKYSETKSVTVTILPAQNSYMSSTRNGVTSIAYAYWHGSFSFINCD